MARPEEAVSFAPAVYVLLVLQPRAMQDAGIIFGSCERSTAGSLLRADSGAKPLRRPSAFASGDHRCNGVVLGYPDCHHEPSIGPVGHKRPLTGSEVSELPAVTFEILVSDLQPVPQIRSRGEQLLPHSPSVLVTDAQDRRRGDMHRHGRNRGRAPWNSFRHEQIMQGSWVPQQTGSRRTVRLERKESCVTANSTVR